MQIDTPLVARLIRSQFPVWAELPIRPVAKSGHDNRTFHLGAEMSVRLPSAEAYQAQVEKEQRYLPLLAPQLPLPIPEPLALGLSGQGFPWKWSVYRWLPGQTPLRTDTDLRQLALDLARFLVALQSIDSSEGPPPGRHNFYRGASLSVYDDETLLALERTRKTLSTLDVDPAQLLDLWQHALAHPWRQQPRWLHGDIVLDNLLVHQGRLSAVIDFGCMGVGDPACDLAIAWTAFDAESRGLFWEALRVDDDLIARAKGWALWKVLITLAAAEADSAPAWEAKRILREIAASIP